MVFIPVSYGLNQPGRIHNAVSGVALPMWEKDMKNVVRFLKDKSGATAIEYGLIAALIAVAVISGVTALGSNANSTFTTVSDEMASSGT